MYHQSTGKHWNKGGKHGWFSQILRALTRSFAHTSQLSSWHSANIKGTSFLSIPSHYISCLFQNRFLMQQKEPAWDKETAKAPTIRFSCLVTWIWGFRCSEYLTWVRFYREITQPPPMYASRIISPWWIGRIYPYKWPFKLFKKIFTDCPRVFRIEAF